MWTIRKRWQAIAGDTFKRPRGRLEGYRRKIIRRCTDERQFPTDHCDRYSEEPGSKRNDGKLWNGSSGGGCDYLRNVFACLQCDADIYGRRYPADGAASYDRYNEKADP